jgi:transposase InsO family protein
MKLHRNARSTPLSRQLLVDRVLRAGWTYAAAGEAAGVSVRTVAKWVHRYRRGGAGALADASSRPGPAAHQTSPAVVGLLRHLRERHGLPGWALAQALKLPRSTAGAWLRRLGLQRLPAAPARPVQRYEWPVPGDMIHVDIKALGRFHQPGHRVHGDRRRASRGAGWEFAHVAVDDHTRLAYVEVLADQRGPSCEAFLRRAVAWFATYGITCRRVLSDNGSGYVARVFRDACATLGLAHRRTRPYTPRTNGKAERFIRTLLRHWAYVRPYATSSERRRALRPWLRFYNHHRPHASLGYQPPSSRLQSATG